MGVYEMMKQRMEEQRRMRAPQGTSPLFPSSHSAVPSAAGPVPCRLPTQMDMPDTAEDSWMVDLPVVKGLMDAVCQSPHVQGNAKYRELVDNLQFKLIERSLDRPAELGGSLDAAEVNAYARMDALTDCFPTICIYAGAIRYSRLMAAAYVASRYYADARPFPQAVVSMMSMFLRNGMRLTSELAAVYASENGLMRIMRGQESLIEANAIAYGTIIGVLAHEFGHLALGHCNGMYLSDEVNRNREREADSFASSVVSLSEYRNVIGIGTIIWELAMTVWQKVCRATATTHPLSAERLVDFIRANPSTAREIGFDQIRELLATAGIILPEE